MMIRVLLGNIESRLPADMAEAAIFEASELSNHKDSRFTLACGPDRRLWLKRVNGRIPPVKPSEFVATFKKGVDPDWLAEEIAEVRGVL